MRRKRQRIWNTCTFLNDLSNEVGRRFRAVNEDTGETVYGTAYVRFIFDNVDENVSYVTLDPKSLRFLDHYDENGDEVYEED